MTRAGITGNRALSLLILGFLCGIGGCTEDGYTAPSSDSIAVKPGSPFGVTVGEQSYGQAAALADLGVKFARLSEKVGAWGVVEPEKGNFAWNYDSVISAFNENGITVMINIKAPNEWANPVINGKYGLPGDLGAYSTFVKKLVERYDGDGIEDAPGAPVIMYWQIENEVDAPFMVWGDTAENYAILVNIAYQAVKEANPDAQVVLSGVQNPDEFDTGFFDNVLKNTSSFDVFDVHVYGLKNGYDDLLFSISLPDYLFRIRRKIGSKPIMATEVATFVGAIGGASQTEKDQASELLKRYVFFRQSGIQSVFWSQWSQAGANFWLQERQTPYLSYYTYKKMTELLEGSDWNNIATIRESGDVYIYKFTKDGNAIYAAWWDYSNDSTYTPGKSMTVSLAGLAGSSAIVTEVVPKFSTGAEVTDYSSAFNKSTVAVSGGSVSLTLGDSPVLVEVTQ